LTTSVKALIICSMKFIVDKIKKQWTPEEVQYLLDVAEFVALDLGITDIRSKVRFQFLNCNKTYHGYCEKDSKRVISMFLFHENDFDALAKTVAHEMVHVKQFLRGELTNGFKWLGSDAWKHAEYEEQPWEHEAEKYEREIEIL